MQSRILVSWIGHADIRAFQAKELSLESAGPLKTLLELERFSAIHLLCDSLTLDLGAFSEWLKHPVEINRVTLADPTSHAEIMAAVRSVLAQIQVGAADELCFHLSPGTPSMAAIWVLLGKSEYPATLFQTHVGKAWKCEIPFDITVDVLPKVLRNPDRFWQHLQVESPQSVHGFEAIIGESAELRDAVGRAKRAAIHDVPVLILGESGTGKELFAEAIHRASGRRKAKFFTLNCAAISRELVESELFGHAKGAFSGAESDHTGIIEHADGGTLFLDEIGECDLALQAKLLRTLQPPHNGTSTTRVFRPVGQTKERSSDVRIIAATNRDLLSRIDTGEFREDLFYRLATVTLRLPPLRERGDDVVLLADSLLDDINRQFKQGIGSAYEPKKLCASAKKFVRTQPWRGNIRELRNVLVQAVVMSDSTNLQAEDLTASIADIPGRTSISAFDAVLGSGFSIEKHLKSIEQRFIELALQQSNGIKEKARLLLGLSSATTLSNHMKKLGMPTRSDQ